MAPLRRYLRITKFSVLECRIYLDNPALAQSWLLNPRNPILPKVIESVRPLVLPKLREEKERERTKKKSKKKNIKDVVVEDEFEVSVFLTETTTRHSLLTKHKHFRDKTTGRLQSNSNKLINETNDTPIDVDLESESADATVPVRREDESDDEHVDGLSRIPAADETTGPRRSKRQRGVPRERETDDSLFCSDDEAGGENAAIEIDDSDNDAPRPSKRLRKQGVKSDVDAEEDDKKKMAMDVSYEGFAIYGRVLCLVVKKRQGLRLASSSNAGGAKQQPAGQASMENWITSTQMPNPDAEEDSLLL